MIKKEKKKVIPVKGGWNGGDLAGLLAGLALVSIAI